MIPSYFMQLDSIPLLPNNKVDRLSLPRPEHSAPDGAEYAAPRDKVEEELAGIFQQVLGLERIGIHDNVFDIGGNSLTILSIQRKINELYPGKIQIPDLVQYPAISSLAAALKNKEGKGSERSGREEQFQIFLDGVTRKD